jgi:3-phosphoshikimate 1-carboxyvinyltransferase
MEDSIVIMPFLHPLVGEIILPGSKSITNRALILSALSENSVEIHNALISDDTLIMVNALKKLGFSVEVDELSSIMTVKGLSGHIPNSTASFNVGNAGTVARFLPAILCLHPHGCYHLDGSPAMRKRPMKDLLDSLEALGAATIIYHQEIGHFPFTIHTHGLLGGEASIDSSKSSQILSALLLIAPLSSKPLTIKVINKVISWPFIEMTLQMMREFGQVSLPPFINAEFSFLIQAPYKFLSKNYYVEPDLTSASYFFALNLIIGGQLKFSGLTSAHSLQGDLAFARILQSFGLNIEKSAASWNLKSSGIISINLNELDFSTFSDTFLTLAAISPLFKIPIHITGIAHTRFQETDRITAVSKELRKLNQDVIASQDSIIISPKALQPATIDTHGDHRIAMSFAILGSYNLFGDGTPWISINNPNCCAKTFPNFFNILDSLKNIKKHQEIYA